MADPLDYERTFPGDPNPPARAPRAAAPPAAPAAEPAGVEPAAAPAAQQSRPAKAVFRVSVDDSGRQSVYMMDDKLETTRLGPVSMEGADELLHQLGSFNEITHSWEVPEDVAKQLTSGDIPVDEYVLQKYRANKALIARGSIYTDWLAGKTSLEDAQGRGDLETLKMQVKEAPLFAWQGDVVKTVAKMWKDARKAGPSGAARRVAGETAGMAAFVTDAPFLGAAGLTAGAAIVATRGAAAPIVAATLAKGLETGAGVLVFKRAYEIEGGNAAAEMLDKGFDEKTVKEYAPLVGVVNGALEVVSFRLLAAPFKRVMLRQVLASETVKKSLATAYVNYMKELGGEVTQEMAQERVNIFAEAMAADAEGNPNLAPSTGEGWDRTVNAGLAAALGAGGMKVPGLVLEAGAARIAGQLKGELRKKVETALAPAQETPVQPPKATPPAPGSPAAGPTVDPAGDYLEPPAPPLSVQQLEERAVEQELGKISEDELVAWVDKIVNGEAELGEMDATPQTFGEKVEEVERKTRIEALKGDLAANQAQIKGLADEMARYERNGMSTKVIERKLDALMEENANIRSNIEFYDKAVASRVGVGEQETLAMKPATLENIVRLGFKEGRKEVIEVRARQIKEIAAAAKLTNADLRLLLRNKNFGTMGDVEFRHWIEGHENAKGERVPGFREAVAAHVTRKEAVKTARKTLKERQIRGEQHIRALHSLPVIGKMNLKQLKEYVDILNSYDEGSVALTPKRIKALETTVLKGAKTFQDVLALAAKTLKRPIKDLMAARKGQFDTLRGDTELSESQALYAFVVDEMQTAEMKAEARFQAFERANHRLGAAALASRARFGSLRHLVPSMPEVMAHLEADPAQLYSGEITVPEITTEEQTYVEFLQGSFAYAREYLFFTGELESTRFEDTYAPHTRRTVAEILVGIKDTGLRKALGEIVDNWFAVQAEIGGPEAGGPALGLRKFFRQTLFRSGGLTPSRNVIRASTGYFKQFFKKQALDAAIPTVDTVVEALRALGDDQSEEGRAQMKALAGFIKTYLNNKKGINATLDAVAPRGGLVDMGVRFVSGWVSLAYIAGNLALQLSAPIGETMASVPLLGARGLLRGNARKWSKQGRAILDKYEFFTGKGALDVLLEPGKNVTERAATLLYGLLQWGRTRTLETLLLASMTDAEFQAGTISAERLAELRVHAGRWMDIHGLKSVAGSTSIGAAVTKFRGWMLPIVRTLLLDDLPALLNSLGVKTPGSKPLTVQQTRELYRVAEVTLVASLGFMALGDPEEDDESFVGQLKKKVRRELFSLTQVLDPKGVLTVGPVASFLPQVGLGLSQLYHLETYKSGEKEGELKGDDTLAKLLPFSAAYRNFKPKEK